MPGRDITARATAPRRGSGSRRAIAWLVAALTLLVTGIVIGTRITTPRRDEPATGAVPAATVAVSSDRPPSRPAAAVPARTAAGAVAAAARSITAFDGDILLDPVRLRAIVTRIASASSRARLLAAFGEASAQTRAKLGADTVPRPVIVLRTVPVGYRVERFSAERATVAVWYIGIVASGATVQPQQSWRTQVVTLVWEHGGWKVNSFAASSGPTPALATEQGQQSPGELFAAIPSFQEFSRALP